MKKIFTLFVALCSVVLLNAAIIAEGKYVVLGQHSEKKGGTYVYMTSEISSYNASTNTFYVSEDTEKTVLSEVKTTGLADKYIWEVVKSGDGIKLKNGDKFSAWTSANSATLDGIGKVLTVEDGQNGGFILSFDVDASETRWLSYNQDNPRFAYYKNMQQRYELFFVPVDDSSTGDEETAVENVTASTSSNVRKVLDDGQLYIVRDGVRYNALGARVQ